MESNTGRFSLTPQRELGLFFGLVYLFSWGLWGLVWLLPDQHDLDNLLLRLGLLAPAYTAILLSYLTPPQETSPLHAPSRLAQLSVSTFFLGLTLFLLNWQESYFRFPTFDVLGFAAAFILAAGVAGLVGMYWAKSRPVRHLLHTLPIWQHPIRYYLVALTLFPLLGYFTIALKVGRETDFPTFILSAVNQKSWTEFWLFVLLSTLVGGPLGEEIGWRGYALPRMLNHWSVNETNFLLTFMWALWHAPLHFLGIYPGSWVDFIGRFIWMIPLTYLLTWLYQRTNGNLLLAILLHASFNIAPTRLEPTYFIFSLFLWYWLFMQTRPLRMREN